MVVTKFREFSNLNPSAKNVPSQLPPLVEIGLTQFEVNQNERPPLVAVTVRW